MLAAAVDQGVLVDPAHAGGIRPKGGGNTLGQAFLRLVEVLQHPRACPVEVGIVLEQHINEGVAEERVAAHCLRPRHREHGGGQRVGHLVLDNLRCLPGEACADDDLGVGQIRQCIQRRVAQRPDAQGGDEQGGQQYQEAVADRPVDQARDHGWSPSLRSCSISRPEFV